MLVTVSELANYMDRSLDNRQQDSAEVILAGLHAEVEAEVNRPIEPTEFVENFTVQEDFINMQMESYFYDRSLDYSHSLHTMTRKPYMLRFANTPVNSVTSVVLTPFSDALSPTTLEEGTHYIPYGWGIDLYMVARNDKVTVTYDAGLQSNNFIKLIILRAAAREMQNMTDDVVGLKDFQNRQATIAEIGLTQAERQSLRQFKRKNI